MTGENERPKGVHVRFIWPDGEAPSFLPEELRAADQYMPSLVGLSLFNATGVLRRKFSRYGINLASCNLKVDGKHVGMNDRRILKETDTLQISW